MPRASTGDLANARTLLSAFGEPVGLQDSSEISGIYTVRKEIAYDSSEAVERTHYSLAVPVILAGTFGQGQDVRIRGLSHYVVGVLDAGDGWLEAALGTPTEVVILTPIDPSTLLRGYGPGYGRGYG